MKLEEFPNLPINPLPLVHGDSSPYNIYAPCEVAFMKSRENAFTLPIVVAGIGDYGKGDYFLIYSVECLDTGGGFRPNFMNLEKISVYRPIKEIKSPSK